MNFWMLVFLFGFSSLAWTEPLLVLNQPQEPRSVDDLFPLQWEWPETVSEREYLYIFIGQVKNPDPSPDEQLELGRARKINSQGKQAYQDLWSLIALRASELGVVPRTEVTSIRSERIPLYDNSLDINSNGNNNPVQNFLREKMGLDNVESSDLYQAIQKGYIQNGLPGAREAFHAHLSEKLTYEIVNFSSSLLQLEKTYRVIESVPIPANYSEKYNLVEWIMYILENGQPIHQKVIMNFLKSSGREFDLFNDKEAIRSYFLENWEAYRNNSTIRLMIEAEDKEGKQRILDGFRRELDGRRHANGPKSRLHWVNTRTFNILRYLLLKQQPLSRAVAFVELLAREKELVIELRHDEPLQKMWQQLTQGLFPLNGCSDLVFPRPADS